MEISRKSWHYRMTAWCCNHYGKTPSNSLCGYFWQMVFSPFVVILMYVTILVVALTMLWGLYFSGAMVCNVLHWFNVLPDSFDMVPGVFNWRHLVASLLITICLIGHILHNIHKDRNPTKKSNVVFEFIKAKKRKICPLIEFKD